LKKGYKVLGQASDVPGIILDVLIFSQDVIDKRPNDIKAVVKSLSDALALVKADPQGSINIMADRMGMTAAEMKSGLDGMHQPDLAENKKLMTARSGLSLYDSGSAIIDFYLERGQLSRIPEIYNMIEPKFVKELGTE
jgi:NitT/TauT family transport system substrate-binding protein